MKSVCQYFKIAVLVRSMFFSAVWPSLGRIKVMIKTVGRLGCGIENNFLCLEMIRTQS